MSDREKILRYYRASGDGELAARLLDIAEIALRNNKYKVSDFLDPYGLSIAETIISHYDRLALLTNGGYTGAERVKIAFVSKEFAGTPIFDVQALLIRWDARYHHLTHRDILGALMAQGITRDIIGDIIMCGQECQVIIDKTFADFIIKNLIEIGSAAVSVSTIDLSEIAPREEKVKEIKSTVPSLRIDVVAATAFGLSRSKMATEITADKLKLNWQEVKNSAQAVKIGDVISMRGRGRAEVCEILGQTKKGRISVLLKRYI